MDGGKSMAQQRSRSRQRLPSIFYSAGVVSRTGDSKQKQKRHVMDRSVIFGSVTKNTKKRVLSSRNSFKSKVNPETSNNVQVFGDDGKRTTFSIVRAGAKRKRASLSEVSNFASILQFNHMEVHTPSAMVVYPESMVQGVWNLVMFVATVIVLGSIPYLETFSNTYATNKFWVVLWPSSLVIDCLYAIDIWLRVNHFGVRNSTGLLVQRSHIRLNYIVSSRFAIDLVSTIPLTTLGLYFSLPSLRITGIVLRLLRVWVVKSYVKAFWQSWTKTFYKDSVGSGRTIRRMSKLISGVMIVTYTLGCLFFALSYLQRSEGSEVYLDLSSENVLHTTEFVKNCTLFCFTKESTEWDLVTALYFSLQTLFTVGYGDVFPESPTSLQVIFTNFAVLCGAMAHALVIANISSMLKNLDITGAAFRRQMNQLQSYIKGRRLSIQLQTKLVEYFDYLWVRQRGRMDSQLLRDLPRTLREEMTQAKRSVLFRVPLFRNRNYVFLDAIVSCLQRIVITKGGVFAKEGEEVEHVFFLIDGRVQVVKQRTDDQGAASLAAREDFKRSPSQFVGALVDGTENYDVIDEVNPGSNGVFGEQCLFDPYPVFQHTFRAKVTSEFQVLSVDAFQELLDKFSSAVLHTAEVLHDLSLQPTALNLRRTSRVQSRLASIQLTSTIESQNTGSVTLSQPQSRDGINSALITGSPPPQSRDGIDSSVSHRITSKGVKLPEDKSTYSIGNPSQASSSANHEAEKDVSLPLPKTAKDVVQVNHRASRFQDASQERSKAPTERQRSGRRRSSLVAYTEENELVKTASGRIKGPRRHSSESSAPEIDPSSNSVPRQHKRDVDAVGSIEVSHMVSNFRTKRQSMVSDSGESKTETVVPIVPVIDPINPDALVKKSIDQFQRKHEAWVKLAVSGSASFQKRGSAISMRKSSSDIYRTKSQEKNGPKVRRLQSTSRIDSDDNCLCFLAVKARIQGFVFAKRRDRYWQSALLLLYFYYVIWAPLRLAYHPLRYLTGVEIRDEITLSEDFVSFVIGVLLDVVLLMNLLFLPSLESLRAFKRNKDLEIELHLGDLVTDIKQKSRSIRAVVIVALSIFSTLSFVMNDTWFWAIARCSISVLCAVEIPKQLLEVVLQFRSFKLETMFAIALQVATVVLVILHWGTCGWVALEYSQPRQLMGVRIFETSNNFTFGDVANELGVQGMPVDRTSRAEWYVRSFYWALVSVATVGFGDIVPVTMIQRIYAMFAILVGATIYAGFISILAAITHHIEVYEDHIEHVSNCIQTYLLNREYRRELVDKCLAYLEHESQERRALKDTTVLNNMIPNVLRRGMMDEIMGQTVKATPLFANVPPALVAAVVDDLQPFTFCPGDLIVSPVTANDGVFAGLKRALVFLEKGTAEVLSQKGMVLSSFKVGGAFGSISLFHPEKQQLKLRAVTYCEVWALFSHNMNEILDRLVLDGTIVSREVLTNSLVAKAEELMDKAGGNVAKNLHNAKLTKLMQTNDETTNQKVEKYIMLPSATITKAWHIVMFLCTFYNLGGIPYRVAFLDGPALNQLVIWLLGDIVTDTGYVVDIYLRFRHMAIDSDNKLVTTHLEISKLYRKSGMVLDVLASFPIAYIVLVLQPSVTITAYAPARLLTCLRGRRILFYRDVIQRMLPINESVQRVTLLLLAILASAHWAGCLFFLLARKVMEIDPSIPVWTNSGNAPELLYMLPNGTVDLARDSIEAYSWSVYWAIATLTTVGYGDYHAVNIGEVVYSTVLLILGGFIYASLLSSLEEIVAQSDISSILFQRQMDMLNDYIALRKLPRALNARLVSYQQMLWTRQKGVEESWLHNQLPLTLRREIRNEMIGPSVLRKIPLFKDWGELDALVDMLKPATYIEGTAMFLKGEAIHRMYIMVSGKAELVSDDGNSVYTSVIPGDTVGELSFYYREPAQCAVRVVSNSDVLLVDRQDLDEWLAKNPALQERFNVEVAEIEEDLRKRCGLEAFTKNFSNAKVGKMFQQDENDSQTKRMGDFVMHPEHRFRRWWNVVILVTVAYNTIAAPYCAVFYEGYYVKAWFLEPFKVFDTLFDILLLVDVILNARYFTRVSGGVMLKTRKEIFPNYAKTTMPLDIIAWLPIDAVLFLVRPSTMSTLGNARLLRLLAIRKSTAAYQSCEAFAQEVNIHVKSGYRKLLAMLLAGLLAIHVIACIRGKINSSARPSRAVTSLITFETFDPDQYDRDGVFMEYIRCQFWSFYTITTVGFGGEKVEYPLFAIFCMLFGTFLCDAGVTATMSNMISNEEAKDASMKQRSDSIMQYLQSNKVDEDTEKKVLEYLRFQLEKQMSLDERSLLSEKSMPEHMRIEVVTYVALELVPNLTYHPSFAGFDVGLTQTLASLLDPEVVASGMTLFASDNEENSELAGSYIGGSLNFALQAASSEKSRQRDTDTDDAATCLYFMISGKVVIKIGKNAKIVRRGVLCESSGIDMARTLETSEFFTLSIANYRRLNRFRSSIGGKFCDMEEMLQNDIAATAFRKFIEPMNCHEDLDLYLSMQQCKVTESSNGRRDAQANLVCDSYLRRKTKKLTLLPSVLSESEVEQLVAKVNAGNVEENVFDTAMEKLRESFESEFLDEFMLSKLFYSVVVK